MARPKIIENVQVKGKVRRKAKKKPEPEKQEIIESTELVLPALAVPVGLTEDLYNKAKLVLSEKDTGALASYIKVGGYPLAVDTALAFFELYLNGYDCEAIHEINSAFPKQSIVWARVEYEWDKKKSEYMTNLHSKIVEKVAKAQLETTNLMADLLTATTKRYGNKIKKYLQTENEEDLGDSLQIDNVHQLLKLVDGIQKITGQDKTKNINHRSEITKNVNMNVTGTGAPQLAEIDGNAMLNEEEAASVLETLAVARRRKARETT